MRPILLLHLVIQDLYHRLMEPRLLSSFVAVAEELHFGRAARRLHISQPPLSAQIKRLEHELGVRLFDRNRHGVRLTEPGELLLGRARRLLVESERAKTEVQRVARGEGGVLSIGYAPNATFEVLPRLVPIYRKRWPDVRLELVEMRSPEQPEALREGRIEVGFACLPVDTSGLVERVLAREPMVVVLPARHPLARRATVPVRALHQQPYVGVPATIEPGWARASMEALRRAGVTVELVQMADSKLAMLGLVAAGLGLSVVSASMAAIAPRGVVFRPLTGISTRLALGILVGPRPSPRAAALAELACA